MGSKCFQAVLVNEIFCLSFRSQFENQIKPLENTYVVVNIILSLVADVAFILDREFKDMN